MRDPSDPYADERHANGPTPDQLWAAEQRRREHTNRAQAIHECTLCDPDGYRGTTVCNHQDHTQTAKRHMAQIRAQMGWPAPTTPDHP
ncbi:hypothetical protein [Mycolicibacterium sp.]|uniref:hypothetical protein n=1 Tax=Mycolicibacterium sp. TaxID=2320850 RepID=UPI00355CA95D